MKHQLINIPKIDISGIDNNAFPKTLLEKFYNAYRKFAELLHSDKFTVKFRLKAGDIFCFNNRRILHGRTEFDPNSGHRHLQGYYMDKDDIIGRLNYLNNIEV